MEDILKNNPLTTNLLQEWFTKKMIKALEQGSVSHALKESFIDTVISVEKLAPIIKVNPRSLFDFFDTQQVYILPIMNRENLFSATVCGVELKTNYSVRIDAETLAVREAFVILENKIENERKES